MASQQELKIEPSQFLLQSTTVWIACATCLLALITRIASSANASAKVINKDGVKTIPAVPYFLPLVGHIPNMALNADGFLRHLRGLFPHGTFTLNFGGTKHNVLYSPGLVTALLNQNLDSTTNITVVKQILVRSFGYPENECKSETYDRAHPDIMACYKTILSDPGLSEMVSITAGKIKENVCNLVTGAESLVDQMPWERTSNVKMATNRAQEKVFEASFFPLIRDFAATLANASIMGSDFLANNPNFFEHLWRLDRGFLLLATGLPWWLPIPRLAQAHTSQRRLIAMISEFEEAMDRHFSGEPEGSRWSNLEDVGVLIKARLPVYRKHGWSIEARAATELGLLWAANANSNPLIFWMLMHIYADQAVLEQIREEIAPFVSGIEPGKDFAFAEPARLEKFDIEGLSKHCPLLKSVYIECLRMDTASWSFKIAKEDFVLQSREKETHGWLVRKGEYCHAAHDLHNSDAKVFPEPTVFKADRHVRWEQGQRVADMGSIRPYGGGPSMCKGRAFAMKECLMFTAAVVAMWDIEPAGGQAWEMPQHRKTAGVYGIKNDVRVWMKRRS